jgi:hypothetical protein
MPDDQRQRLVSFGKCKGQPVELLTADRGWPPPLPDNGDPLDF